MAVKLSIRTGTGSELVDITSPVQDVIKQTAAKEGICLLFVPHTTAGLTLNENWDPAVRDDILHALERIAPYHGPYRHAEGNSAAHIKATLCGFDAQLLIHEGQLVLGAWQGIYLAEFDGPRERSVWVHVTPSD